MGLRPSIWLMKWENQVAGNRGAGDEGAGDGDTGGGGAGSRVIGWLLQPAARSWQLVSLAVLLGIAVSTSLRANWGSDNAFVVKAAETLLAGGSPYEDKRFLYLPSAVLMAVPEALLPREVLRWLLPLGMSGLLGAGWLAALRIFAVPLRSRFAVGGFAVFALVYKPYVNLVLIGNWTAISAAALPVALLLAQRRSWGSAGLVVGLAIACKPMLVPLGLLFLVARRWRALAAAVLVPLGFSLAGALVMPSPSLFFTKTLPFLLQGQDSYALPWDASPIAVLPRLGVPAPVAVLVAFAGAGAGLWAAWVRWRREDADGGELRLVETSCMVMLAAFLVSRPSFDHYLLVVLPLLMASVVRPDAAARSPWFWAVLGPQVAGIPWPSELEAKRRAFKDCATLCGLAFVLARRALRPGRVTLEPVTTAGSPPRTEPECAATPAESASRTAF
ncbi:membrane protein [Streptomyces nojiriensis]|uniref:Membrane protein n=2 Tax=Streptomyces nojiriensis TaxID=66374 RepID=A0ABQ3T039_9ACTN|nr:Alpha-(1->3)-arabinofuranosyltransferase [Streptomyces nojiriensis]GGR79558.1 membrane protein [Streptomyces nojiriensis]GHI73775.1 membrane protein [Streptomyces nojiriensis]